MIGAGGRAPGPLPPATRLVHIGPHKTGTTAVQQALHMARADLSRHGVRYSGTEPQAYAGAIGLTGRSGRLGDTPPSEKDWLALVEEARSAGDARYVASSESFANAAPEHVRRLAADLGPQVHVLRMVRRYDKLVASQWQQSVAAGHRYRFTSYVDAVTADPDAAFWRRHGFSHLTRRWAEGVGRDRVTVVVVDETDRRWLLRVFERLLDLPDGLLALPPEDANRSLTAAEVQLIRQMNTIRVSQQWHDLTHLEYVRRGVSVALRELPPDPQDGRIEIPSTLRPLLQERTATDLVDLERLGVAVVGDPHGLLVPDAVPSEVDATAAGSRAEPSGSLRVESARRAASAVVQQVFDVGGFPLGGAGAALAAPLPQGRRRALDAGERRLVAELEAQPWPEAVVDRFVHRGLVRWLRRSGAGPRRHHGRPDVIPADRIDPGRVALGLSGIIAQSDPAAGVARG